MKTSTQPVIYDSANRGSPAIEELRDIFQYRDLIYQFVRRDLVTRYKRSVLGIAWTLIQPLGIMLIISLVFSQLFHRVEGYSVYLLSGLITWTFFSQTTNGTIHQMVWGGVLLKKIYLPSTVFAVSATGTGLVNLALSLIPLIIIAALNHITLNRSLLILPISMILLATFALGLGLLISTLAVFFPDVAEMYQVLLTGWWYLTPIIYPMNIVPKASQWWFQLNPMYYFVQMIRMPIHEGVFPPMYIIQRAVVIAIFTLVLGWIVFSSKSDEFAYRA
jgi:ABC-type polysaccharide/polyol phosphate export permease